MNDTIQIIKSKTNSGEIINPLIKILIRRTIIFWNDLFSFEEVIDSNHFPLSRRLREENFFFNKTISFLIFKKIYGPRFHPLHPSFWHFLIKSNRLQFKIEDDNFVEKIFDNLEIDYENDLKIDKYFIHELILMKSLLKIFMKMMKKP